MKKCLCLLAVVLPMLLSGCSQNESAVPELEYAMDGTVWLPQDGNSKEMIFFSKDVMTYSVYSKEGEKLEGEGGRSSKYTYSHPLIQLKHSEGLLGDEKFDKAGEFLKGIDTIIVDSSLLTVKMSSGEVRVFVPRDRR